MELNNKELEAIKELIYLEIDNKNGIENIGPDLNTTLWKINNINNEIKSQRIRISYKSVENAFSRTSRRPSVSS